jgi:steroid delta-isomerase-like uncharacterized protein
MAAAAHTGAQPIDDAFLAEFIEGWSSAWNSRDPERVIAWMHPDCVYDDSAWPTTMRSHDDARAFFRAAWRAVPDLEFWSFIPARVPGEAKAMAHWQARGTMTGPLHPPGFAPTGGRIEFDGFDYYEFRDGKLARLNIVFDMVALGRQIRAMPPAGGLAERPVVWLQRLQARIARRRKRAT